MNKWKELWNKLIKPNLTLSIISSILCVAIIVATIVLLCLGNPYPILSYILYGLSAVALTYLIYLIVYYAPKVKQGIINLIKKNKFTRELYENYGYRNFVFTIRSFIFNIAYAVFQAVIAIMARSIWYGALATYNIAISLIRGGIVYVTRRKRNNKITLERQIKSYRNCGIYLVLLNFALTGAVVQMVIANQGFKYAGMMIYVMAAWTFYKLGMSIYNMIKARKQKDYTLMSVKNLGLAESLVSILGLQTAMFQAFATDYIPRLPNSLTGGGVLLIIIAIGVIMIVHGQKKLKKLQKEKTDEQEI